jgi:hypothetical protein
MFVGIALGEIEGDEEGMWEGSFVGITLGDTEGDVEGT